MDIMEVIGVDHGWSYIKTVGNEFVTGVKEMTTEPALTDGILEYNGRYYKIGGKRLEVKDTKTETEDFWLLTLAAVGAELRKRGKNRANVMLSAGLPLTMFGSERKRFFEYLNRQGEIRFRFEGRSYQVTIGRVMISPQCYAAVIERIKLLPNNPIIVDIGSWTIDILPIIKGVPDESQSITSPNGLITCMRAINDQLVRQCGNEVNEFEIQEVMINGTSSISEKYLNIITSGIIGFTKIVEGILHENSINLETRTIVFVGGGAGVMKRFSSLNGANIHYIEDIRANAKGFEYLGKLKLHGMCK